MPVYDYACPACGPFTETRPMALSAEPCACPECGEDAPRAFFTVPFIAGMDQSRRLAFATNEKSRHEPKFSASEERGTKAHGANCSCCGLKTGRPVKSSAVYTADGSKTFPSKRPWMISH